MTMEPDALSEKFRQWAQLKAQKDLTEKRLNKLRDDLMEIVAREGDKDERGNTHFALPQAIEVAGQRFHGIKREARTGLTFKEDEALAFVKARGLWDQVVVNEPVVDQDALHSLHQQGIITDDELAALFETRTSYAFKPETV